jgi:hypothetical protein
MYDQPRSPETRTSRRDLFPADPFFPLGWVPSDFNINRFASAHAEYLAVSQVEGLRSTCSQKRVQ